MLSRQWPFRAQASGGVKFTRNTTPTLMRKATRTGRASLAEASSVSSGRTWAGCFSSLSQPGRNTTNLLAFAKIRGSPGKGGFTYRSHSPALSSPTPSRGGTVSCWRGFSGSLSSGMSLGQSTPFVTCLARKTRRARNFPLWCLFSTLALLSWGEFWHANHHARQRSAFFGWRWFEFDPGKWFIKIAEKMGLVWDVETPGVAGE